MTGMEETVKQVSLLGEQLFDHSKALRPMINQFVAVFEKSERHKEFDGILRASHSLVEAAETASDRLLESGRLQQLTDRINGIANRLEACTVPTYGQEHEEYLSTVEREQKAYLDLCEREAMRKMRMAASGSIEIGEEGTEEASRV